MQDQSTSTRLPERFWAKVDKSGDCWVWAAGLTSAGYGQFKLDDYPATAHRLSYEDAHGPLPAGYELVVHHICENRACVNPEHLRAVTPMDHANLHPRERLRKVHCKHGHALDGDNIYIRPDTGKRACRACRAERDRARRST